MHDEMNTNAPPMHQWATDLFPIHRSLTGDGVRETLSYLKGLSGWGLTIHEVPSGTKAFDWTVPKEWVCREARVEDQYGRCIVDIKNSNLHVVQYSVPFCNEDAIPLVELDAHLHSLPDQPDAIPYVTSYYKETWGFCLTHRQRESLDEGNYFVTIDSELKDGHLSYGELIIPGAESTEVLLSTNICHPSMANNELSGPVVVTALAQWLASAPRRHTYRILFLPETIGALAYLSQRLKGLESGAFCVGDEPRKMLDRMRERTIAGYQVVCCGDTRMYSYLPSRHGETLADRAARKACREYGIQLWPRKYEGFRMASSDREWPFLDRGSDERQWCAPGVDLPVGSIMRSKYDTYPEYHTSLDDLTFISQEGLEGSLKVYQRAIEIIEANRVYKATCIGEPQLGPRGLYHAGGTKEAWAANKNMLNVLAYADGTRDLIDLAETIGCTVGEAGEIAMKLKEHGLLE